MPSSAHPNPIMDALNPSRSVVVEACAGSGKTWLLASRIVCLLLHGVAPSEILAITFTRKAAHEIEERVISWLRIMAMASDEELHAFLRERAQATDEETCRKARQLYESVLTAATKLTVNTFHGWFLQLIASAPLKANLAGTTLKENDSRFFAEQWQSFTQQYRHTEIAADAARQTLADALLRLFTEPGAQTCQKLMQRAFAQRIEWLSMGLSDSATLATHLVDLRTLLGLGETPPLAQFFHANGQNTWQEEVQNYLALLQLSDNASDQKSAADLQYALAQDDHAQCFAALQTVFLTQKNTVRQKKASAALDKRMTPQGATRFLALHQSIGAALIAALEAQSAAATLRLNEDMCTVFAAFLKHVETYKAAQRWLDFNDAEWHVWQLLRDDDSAAFLQARLDARYRHVLLDEFQDTSPLQWQILLAWLAAYSDGARPNVFLVGDPKQSIYRFRRAEPRLFGVASTFLQTHYRALWRTQDTTRRNALPIVDVVNTLFGAEPTFTGFRPQRTLTGDLPGRVELIPLFSAPKIETAMPSAAHAAHLRNPLLEALAETDDSRLEQEATYLAKRIHELVTTCLIRATDQQGNTQERLARFDDIMLVVRSRQHLAYYQRALAAAGIPFVAAARGGLLDALEVRDILALIDFLITPMNHLALAHALRSPIFACSDADLIHLAKRPESQWWEKLQAFKDVPDCPLHLRRAATLLLAWRMDADRLPAHDFLDRIFHQGALIERYRHALPLALQASALANLHALLLLALDADEGRYPSLPRFMDRLRDLRKASADDAPDEGEISAEHLPESTGRVRILTIHGAKGLEAPIVWWLGANTPASRRDSWNILLNWPPEAAAPDHFSFYGRSESRDKARAAFFETEATASAREELNLLYVALTRARQFFIASGITRKQSNEDSAYTRLTRALLTLQKDAATEAPQSVLAHGKLPYVAPLFNSSDTLASAVLTPRPYGDDRPWPKVGERQAERSAAARWGEDLHIWLETLAPTHQAFLSPVTTKADDTSPVHQLATTLLHMPHLRRFFDPQAYVRAWNELEILDVAGHLQRIDRLVEYTDECWVLDYKSGHRDSLSLVSYQTQVRHYCQSVATLFPTLRIRGLLIFADGATVDVEAV